MVVEFTAEQRIMCPSCGNRGRRVSPLTVRSLLKDDLRSEVVGFDGACCQTPVEDGSGCHSVTEDTGYRFCDSSNCDVVYFTEADGTLYTKSQLKVPVGLKEATGDRPLCYCFGHSVATIKDELRTKGRSDALDDIRRRMKGPGCHCETANPSGACCLGSVAKGIQIATKELEIADSPLPTAPTSAFKHRAERLAKIGTLLSAIVASSCCWLPLLLLAVGVSSAGVASTLEAYRLIFIAVTFGALAAAFFFTNRRRKAATAQDGRCESQTTAKEDCCATGRRVDSMSLNKVTLWLVTILAVAFLFSPSYVGAFLGSVTGQQVTTKMTQATIQVEGMTCEGCSAVVANAIRKVSGVLAVEVDYKSGKAVVGTEACCPIPEDEILAALKSVGYSGIILEARSAPPDAGQTEQIK